MKAVRAIFELFKKTIEGFGRDRAPLLAAAIAYYTTLSLAPLLVISVGIAGLVFGEAAVEGQIVGQIEQFVGTEIAQTIELIIENAASVNSSGILATVVGVVVLFIGASGVINQLRTALNMIWGIRRKPKRGAIAVIKERILSFMIVLGIGFLMVVSVSISIVLTTLRRYLSTVSQLPVESFPRLDIVAASLVVLSISFAIVFKILPDARVAWRDVWLGALVTALLFALGEYLIGLYLAYSSVGSAYGAAGSLVIILTWIYYSALILMLGAEFTQVFANMHGSRIRPSSNALIMPEPIPEPPPARRESIAVPEPELFVQQSPSYQSLRQVAAALVGMAFGLLLAFLSSLRKKRE